MSKFFRHVTSRLKTGLDALLAPAEDPREVYADAYERQQQLLEQVRHAQAENAHSQERLATRARQLEQRLPRQESLARQALVGGREDLARLALQQFQALRAELRVLSTQVQELQQEGQRLATIEQRLVNQAESFQNRQEVIAARSSAAEAQMRVTEALSGASQELSDLGLALEQATQRAEHLQARASAIDGLIEDGVLDATGLLGGDAGAQPLAQFELMQSVEEQLALLKQQLNGGAAA
jgi:phage shock protein A